MRSRVDVLGVLVDNVSMEQAFERAKSFFEGGGKNVVVTPNSEIIMKAVSDDSFAQILNEASLCVPDGIGVVYASKILKTPLPERVTGFDLTCRLLEYMGNNGLSVFLFGAKPTVAEIAGERLREKYPGLRIAGVRDGYFTETDEPQIVDEINRTKPDLLLVCLGAPKQEKWIEKHKEALDVKVFIGAGGSLDVFAGVVKRAPDIFIKLHLEWFYRLLKQPKRILRQTALLKFIFVVLSSRKGGRAA